MHEVIFFTCLCVFDFYVRRMGYWRVSYVKGHGFLGTKGIVFLMLEKEWAHWGPSTKLDHSQANMFQLVDRRKMAEILSNWRETIINQSIIFEMCLSVCYMTF